MTAALYFDHNMQHAVVTALRDRGLDILTSLEDGYDRQPDDRLLDRALTLRRILVTHDQDFLEIAARRLADSVEFPGIVFCHFTKSSIGGLVMDLEFIATATSFDELRNQVVWVPL